ncbi:hypothetical protein BFS15_06970 [Gardnerella sp. DNF01162]|uniref:IS3 family transposase n=1 Tax=Gardnerella TaxID=2701 RepID=UPI000CBC6000|nr:IS3 family transposase [Gardnerella sp. DNF01162]PNP88548.1 hypothetical protein BFS15_06970 [Gardnerella sp. DNF01162]RFD73266.1 hypothetical protein AXE72_04380 [Gardnerella vaginalis]
MYEGSSPFKQRIGLLERKIRVVKENSYNETDWLKWSKHAFLNLFMVFNIKEIVFFWQEKTFLQHNWDSTEKLRQAIHTYIDSYNNHRIKMGLKRQLWNIMLWLHKMSKNCPKPLLFSMSSNTKC